MWSFVTAAGRRLGRPQEEVEPYVRVLEDNWFDSPQSLAEARPEELASLDIPLRFAKELIAAATSDRGDGKGFFPKGYKGKGGKDGGKGKDRGHYQEDWSAADAGHGGKGGKGDKGKGKGKLKGKAKGKEPEELAGEFQHLLELPACDPSFRIKGQIIGTKGQNIRHIEQNTGTRLHVYGEDGMPMQLQLAAHREEDLREALHLAQDLIGTAYRDHGLKPPDMGLPWGKGGKGKAKGKAKGKEPGQAKGKEPAKGKAKGKAKGEFCDSLELFEVNSQFSLRGTLLGEGGRNVFHIQDAAKCQMWLVPERSEHPTELQIATDSQESLDMAVGMAQDLVGSAREEYDSWLASGKGAAAVSAEAKGKGKGKGKEAGKGKAKGKAKDPALPFRRVLKLKEVHIGFHLRAKLIGEGGTNTHHIQDATGARLFFSGDSANGEALRAEISAPSQEELEKAVNMAKDLIRHVYKEYDTWQAENEEPQAKRQRQF